MILDFRYNTEHKASVICGKDNQTLINTLELCLTVNLNLILTLSLLSNFYLTNMYLFIYFIVIYFTFVVFILLSFTDVCLFADLYF